MTYNTLQMYHVAVEVPSDQGNKVIGINNHRFRTVRMSEAMTRTDALQAQKEIVKATPDSKVYIIEAVSVIIT